VRLHTTSHTTVTVHTLAVIIITLHIRKCVIFLHLTWLNNKKLVSRCFYFFLQRLNSGSSLWLSLLPNRLRLSLLSTQPTPLWTAHRQHHTIVMQQYAQLWTTNNAATLNIYCSAICTQTPVKLTSLLGVWKWHGDLKNSQDASTHWSKKLISPKKRGSLTEPHYMFCEP